MRRGAASAKDLRRIGNPADSGCGGSPDRGRAPALPGSVSDGSLAPPCSAITVYCAQPAASGTRRAMAQIKPVNSRAIAAVTTLAGLPLRASLR